jgi:tetratricopeptide (TPR) repeat protein
MKRLIINRMQYLFRNHLIVLIKKRSLTAFRTSSEICFLIVLLFLGQNIVLSQSNNDIRIDAYGKLLSGAYIEAVGLFSEIERNNKLTSQDRLSFGIAQFKSDDLSSARKNFQLAESAGLTDASLWLARIYASGQNTGDAILFIERYLRTSQNPDVEGIQKDSSFRSLHESNKWFDLWQTDWYNENQKIIQEAMFYSGRKKYEAAHRVIESNITDDLSGADLYFWNGKIYIAEENITLALNEFNQAIRLNPNNTTYLKERAKCNSLLNNFSVASEDLNLAIEIDPVDFELRLLRAKTAFLSENYELASEDITLYLKYFNTEDAIYFAGQISYASGNYFDALKYYNRLMEEAKPNAGYFAARGMTYYQTNTFELASKDLSMSLDLDPENPQTNLYMGLSEYYKGNNKVACYYWKRASDFGEIKAVDYLQKYCR